MESGEWDKCLPFPEYVNRAVLDAMESEDDEVRYTMLPAVRWLADLNPRICADAFDHVLRALTDRDERIRVDCLRLLSAFGIDRVSSAVSDIRKALADASPEVQRSACNLLGWLEEDATGAIDDLMKCVGPGRDDAVRRAAALAIAKINPSGDRLSSGSGGKAVRADLLKFLREAGAVGRILRRSLEHGQSNDSSDSTSDSDLELQLFEVLTKKQLKFVRYLLKKRKPVRFDDLRTNIWRGKTTDENIEKMVQRANENLLQLKDTSLTIYTKDMHAGVTRSDK
jgi:hypothetical protein